MPNAIAEREDLEQLMDAVNTMEPVIEPRPFQSSPGITQLVTALAKAQGGFAKVEANKENTHFKNRYATLGAYLESIREPLAENKLAVMQIPDGTNATTVSITTVLTHESGEWISCTMEGAPDKVSLQGTGSAMSYIRRYALASMLSLAQFDDDGVVAVKVEGETISKDQAIALYNYANNMFGDDGESVLNALADKIMPYTGGDYVKIRAKHYDAAIRWMDERKAAMDEKEVDETPEA